MAIAIKNIDKGIKYVSGEIKLNENTVKQNVIMLICMLYLFKYNVRFFKYKFFERGIMIFTINPVIEPEIKVINKIVSNNAVEF